MIGIYKITNPKGKIYIGQSSNIEKRKVSYSKLNCKTQIKLYNSLVKYGFLSHIFEIVEECEVVELNIRERHWQDFYNVISEQGLNCKLQSTSELRAVHSQESIAKGSAKHRAFLQTAEGKESRARGVVNTDYSSFQVRRVANTDYVLRSQNMNYHKRSEKFWKALIQFKKDGTFIREWTSGKEASNILKINRGSICSCCKGKAKSAGGFIWKYREIKLEN